MLVLHLNGGKKPYETAPYVVKDACLVGKLKNRRIANIKSRCGFLRRRRHRASIST
jgi:hypothetical protein